jgi:hypothetical protein
MHEHPAITVLRRVLSDLAVAVSTYQGQTVASSSEDSAALFNAAISAYVAAGRFAELAERQTWGDFGNTADDE